MHLWTAAETSSERAIAALAILSWIMWLRVGEATFVRLCDLDCKEGIWFYSTKILEERSVCCLAG